MNLREPITLYDLFEIIRAKSDKGVSYCVYSCLTDTDEAALDTICYLDEYADINDDEEVFPSFVVKNGLNFLFREELLQDVITNALHQKPSASNQEILEAVKFYNSKDAFISLS